MKDKLKLYINGQFPDFYKWLVENQNRFNKKDKKLANSITLLLWDIDNKKRFHLQEILDDKPCSFYTNKKDKTSPNCNTFLWLCGQVAKDGRWSFQGIFSNKDLAIKACKTSNYFICPIILDKECPKKIVEFPKVEWPVSGK